MIPQTVEISSQVIGPSAVQIYPIWSNQPIIETLDSILSNGQELTVYNALPQRDQAVDLLRQKSDLSVIYMTSKYGPQICKLGLFTDHNDSEMSKQIGSREILTVLSDLEQEWLVEQYKAENVARYVWEILIEGGYSTHYLVFQHRLSQIPILNHSQPDTIN